MCLAVAFQPEADAKSGQVTREVWVPIGHTASIGNGWRLRVVSVNWNAGRTIAATNHGAGKPRVGRQDVMLLVEASYNVPGTPWLRNAFADRVTAEGPPSSRIGFYVWGNGAGVARNACGWGRGVRLPRPDTIQPLVGADQSVHSGDKLRGRICFEVEKRDLASLRLHVDALPGDGAHLFAGPSHTFALRP